LFTLAVLSLLLFLFGFIGNNILFCFIIEKKFELNKLFLSLLLIIVDNLITSLLDVLFFDNNLFISLDSCSDKFFLSEI